MLLPNSYSLSFGKGTLNLTTLCTSFFLVSLSVCAVVMNKVVVAQTEACSYGFVSSTSRQSEESELSPEERE